MPKLRWSGSIDAAHFIPGHPKCGRLHGHTYSVTIEIDGPTSPSHPKFIIDFAVLKKLVHQLDHRLMVASEHPDIQVQALNMESADSTDHMLNIQWPDGRVTLRPNATVVLAIPETSYSVCRYAFADCKAVTKQ